MLFKDIIAQNSTKYKLIQSINENRISHAQLFIGPEGCGSLPLAIAYAQYLNCQSKQNNDSCGVCPSCIKFNKLIHPDLHFVFPVTTTKKITKDPISDDFIKLWREMVLENPYFNQNQWYEFIGIENKQGIISKNESYSIIKKMGLKTFEADYKIMIFWLPEKMNQTAGNKLLKIIEEPPEKTLFIMVAENTALMLPTILSRLQTIKIPKFDKSDIQQALVLKYNLDTKEAESISHVANGNMVKAFEIYNSRGETVYNFEKFSLFMRLCYSHNLPEISNWIDEISSIGREKLKSFLEYSLRLIRENFMLNQQLNEISYLDNQEKEFSMKFSKFINQNNVYKIYEEFNSAYYHIESNAYNKIVFFDMALKIFKLIKQ